MSKVAVWRLGAGFQSDLDSVVGGGKIARQTVEDLVHLGHQVTVLSKVSDQTAAMLRSLGVTVDPDADITSFDACLVLTGPFNPMYQALATTYERLARYEGRVFYAWWDTALPFHFVPERVALFRKTCPVTSKDLARNKRWTVLTQLKHLPTNGSVSCAEVKVHRVSCFWELAEAQGSPDPYKAPEEQRFVYLGSPRPGRLPELKRWFAQPESPPLDLYGKWSPKQLDALGGEHIRYMGPVPEHQVRPTLRRYAATLHSADQAYVKHDFVAQRFMENAMACVPVVYSDKLQPSLRSVIPAASVVRDVHELGMWWARLLRGDAQEVAERHSALVRAWATANPLGPRRILEGLVL